jgi:hypothetical protein
MIFGTKRGHGSDWKLLYRAYLRMGGVLKGGDLVALLLDRAPEGLDLVREPPGVSVCVCRPVPHHVGPVQGGRRVRHVPKPLYERCKHFFSSCI